MKRRLWIPAALAVSALFGAITTFLQVCGQERPAVRDGQRSEAPGPERDTMRLIREGRQTFRFDTFGDEAFWGDALKLHQAVAGAKLGGVGPGLSPKAALAAGLKVDAEALPAGLVQQLNARGRGAKAERIGITLEWE
jgi:hypothetical protein